MRRSKKPVRLNAAKLSIKKVKELGAVSGGVSSSGGGNNIVYNWGG